jgi:quinol monooxygenase YgiN
MNGCVACAAWVDVEDENAFVYTEEWETREALDEHLRTEDVRVLLSALDLASEPPVIRFQTISDTQGMEVIAAARSQAFGDA